MPTYDAETGVEVEQLARDMLADAKRYGQDNVIARALLAATQEVERLTRENEALRKLVASVESPVRYTLATLPVPGAPDVVVTEHKDWTAVHRGRATSAYRQLTAIIGPIADAIRHAAGVEGKGE